MLVNPPGGCGRIGILGPVELVGGGPVQLSGVMERCLLAALAVHCGEVVGAAYLVDALWGWSASDGRVGRVPKMLLPLRR
jgi:DNA-binding SARP family transcriptional activator